MPPKSLVIVTTADHQSVAEGVIPHVKRMNAAHGVDLEWMTTGEFVPAREFQFVLGADALKQVQDYGLAPKNRGLMSMRSQLHQIPDSGTWLCSYSPGIRHTDWGLYTDMQADLMLAHRYARAHTLAPEVGAYMWVEDFTDVMVKIGSLYADTGKRVPVCVDLETTGLDPYRKGAFIVSVSVTYEEGKSLVWYNDDHNPGARPTGLAEILASPCVATLGANFKYDMNWLSVLWDMPVTNFTFDTAIAGSMLDENRSNSLNLHAKIYTDLGGYDDGFNLKYEKGKMETVPKPDLLDYAGGDTDAAFRVARCLNAELKQYPRLRRLYREVIHPATHSFLKMERTGILIDKDYFLQLGMDLNAKKDDITAEVAAMCGRALCLKHPEFSLTKPSIAKDYLFTGWGLDLDPLMVTGKTEQPSTAKAHLTEFEDHPKAGPFVHKWLEYAAISKTMSTYVTGFLAHLRADGRFHPTYIQFHGKWNDDDDGDTGTVTGRLSAKDPPVQTIPKHTQWSKVLRRGYVAPPGYVILNVDYQQGELRLTACVADEPTMIKAYLEGLDLHDLTASALTGRSMAELQQMKIDDELKYGVIRRSAKAGNFGLIYGMAAEGFQKYAKYSYGVTMSMQEVHAFIDGFFGLYSTLHDWHADARKLAHAHKSVVSPLGRVRHLPLIDSKNMGVSAAAERQAINSPVQSTLSDMVQWSLVEMDRKFGDTDEIRFFLMTHDSLTAYVREDRIDYWAQEIRAVMENLPFAKLGWKPQLPFPIDVEVGPNLAEMSAYTG